MFNYWPLVFTDFTGAVNYSFLPTTENWNDGTDTWGNFLERSQNKEVFQIGQLSQRGASLRTGPTVMEPKFWFIAPPPNVLWFRFKHTPVSLPLSANISFTYFENLFRFFKQLRRHKSNRIKNSPFFRKHSACFFLVHSSLIKPIRRWLLPGKVVPRIWVPRRKLNSILNSVQKLWRKPST